MCRQNISIFYLGYGGPYRNRAYNLGIKNVHFGSKPDMSAIGHKQTLCAVITNIGVRL